MRRSPWPSAALVLALLLLAAGSSGGAPVAHHAAGSHPAPAPRTDRSTFEAGADSNAAWPAGWRRGGNQPGAGVELVSPGHGGARAVQLTAAGPHGFLALIRDLPDSVRAGAVAVRLSGWIRTRDAGRASMWVHLLTSTETIASGDSLVRWPVGTTGWTRYEILMPVLPEVQKVVYGLTLSGGGEMTADDVELEALDPAHAPPSSPVARHYLDAALDTLCRRSVLTSSLNWGVLQRAARTQLLAGKVIADAYDALRYAVHRLDPMGEFVPPLSAAALAAWPPPQVPWFVQTDSGFVVVRLPACTTPSRAAQAAYADSTRASIDLLAGRHTRGWVVDLRVMSNGEVAPALAGLGPLLGEGTLLNWQRPDGRRGRWTQHHGIVEYDPGRAPENRLVSVMAERLELPGVPVAVLVGPRTACAGEAVALAFRGRANTRIMGQPTAGYGQERERVHLSDGAEMRFATGRLSDRNGLFLDGSFMPDDSLNAGLLTGGQDSLTTLALEWVRRAASPH